MYRAGIGPQPEIDIRTCQSACLAAASEVCKREGEVQCLRENRNGYLSTGPAHVDYQLSNCCGSGLNEVYQAISIKHGGDNLRR